MSVKNDLLVDQQPLATRKCTGQIGRIAFVRFWGQDFEGEGNWHSLPCFQTTEPNASPFELSYAIG